MTKWVDYSFARPNLAQMKNDGVKGVLRYLAPDTPQSHGKILFKPEKDALLAAGFDIVLNFEWYEGRCNEGYQAGVSDGQTAVSQAKELGYPPSKVIYFSHDTGVYSWSNIEAYFKGVIAAFGGYYRVGAYGSFELVQHLHSKQLIVEGWQTLAWSYGARDPWAEIYQNGTQLYGGAADQNEVTSTDIGSWLDGPVGGLVSAEYEALKKQLNNLAEMLIDDTTHAGHRSQAAATAAARAEISRVKAVTDDLVVRVAQLQKAVAELKAPSSGGASAKQIVAELGSAIVKGEV